MVNRLQVTGATNPAPPLRLPPGALRVRGRIAATMLAAHALAPEDAIEFSPGQRDRTAFAKLRAAGIVRGVSGERFWFDLVAYHLRERRRTRAWARWGAAIALIGAAIVMLLR